VHEVFGDELDLRLRYTGRSVTHSGKISATSAPKVLRTVEYPERPSLEVMLKLKKSNHFGSLV
jgi:hypothetical protein